MSIRVHPQHSSASVPLTRRAALRVAAGLSFAAVTNAPALSVRAAAAPAICPQPPLPTDRDLATRASYDWALRLLQGTYTPENNNEKGYTAWSTAWVLKSYITMYRATDDTAYLDLFVTDADQVLDLRDNARGVTDYRGRSLPVWRTGYTYSTAKAIIPNAAGVPLFEVRYGYHASSDGLGSVTVSADTDPEYFRLTCTNKPTPTATDTYAHLNLAPASPDYVVPRLYFADPTKTRSTARELRPPGPNSNDMPKTGKYQFATEFHALPVDTGMILDSFAEFCALAAHNPRLQRRYGNSIARYTTAVIDGLAVFEEDWRDNDTGEGWYVLNADAPASYAGTDAPHNHNLAIARCFTHVAVVTRDPLHRHRARQLLTRFRNDLRLQSNAYVWNYFDTRGRGFNGWAREDHVSNRIAFSLPYQTVEDISHASLDIDAAVTGNHHGLIFQPSDLRRFASTYTDCVATRDTTKPDCSYQPPTSYYKVDGTGPLGTADSTVGRWAILAPWNTKVHTLTRSIYNYKYHAATSMQGSILYGIASLAAHAAT